MNSIEVDQTMEILNAMRKQEEEGYLVTDYLSDVPLADDNFVTASTPVDAECRKTMARWAYSIADLCQYKKETIAIALNVLDRFLSTTIGRPTLFHRSQFQLATMTAIYSSVKIHEQQVMPPQLVSSLSRGVHSIPAIEAMELNMLIALKWRMNPPTAMSFLMIIDEILLTNRLHPIDKEIILSMTQQQIEKVVIEYSFSSYKSSSIVSACLLNALESYSNDATLVANIRQELHTIIKSNNNDEQCSIKILQDQIMQSITEDDECTIIGLIKPNTIEKRLSYKAIDNAPKSSPRTVISHAA